MELDDKANQIYPDAILILNSLAFIVFYKSEASDKLKQILPIMIVFGINN